MTQASASAAPAPAPVRAAERGSTLAPLPTVAPPPVIDEIVVDRRALCVGEETLVHVRAHTIDGSDDQLHYTIGPHTGQTVALRAWVDEQGAQLPYDVTVFGRDNVSVSARVPPFTIRPCAVSEHVVVTHRLLPNTIGVFELRATVVPAGSSRGTDVFVPSSYHWSTSDGRRSSGPSSSFTLDLEERRQTSLYTQATVSVEVDDGHGRRLQGNDALQLINPAYEALHRKGVVLLMVRLTPRFPEVDANGIVSQGVELWHQHESAVTIETVQAVRYYAQGRGETPPESVDVAAILGKRSILPGERLRLQVNLDTSREPEVAAVNYYLQGVASGGASARGSFAVMRPPPAPTRENSTPIVEPTMMAKIRSAQALLGRPTVSDEDIWRLEREGKLARPAASNVDRRAAPEPAARRAAPRQPTLTAPGPTPAQVEPGPAPPGPRAPD